MNASTICKRKFYNRLRSPIGSSLLPILPSRLVPDRKSRPEPLGLAFPC
jgi:hypothetical protein